MGEVLIPKENPMLDEQKQRARKTPIYQNIFEDLQQRIRGGEWLPGEKLPSIAQMAKDMDAGAGSVREALRSLESIGLVKIEHGSGVYVTGMRPVTEISGHFGNLGDDLLLALAETRRIIEPDLAALAAERGTDEELAEIAALVRKMEEAVQLDLDFAELDVKFNRSIAKAARNPILFQTIEGVSDLFLESRRAILLDPESLMRALRFHALIADALVTRNPTQAQLLMKGHMNSMTDEVILSESLKKNMEKEKNSE